VKESLYIELCPESSNIEYRVTGDADIVETKVFSGRQYAEDVYELIEPLMTDKIMERLAIDVPIKVEYAISKRWQKA